MVRVGKTGSRGYQKGDGATTDMMMHTHGWFGGWARLDDVMTTWNEQISKREEAKRGRSRTGAKTRRRAFGLRQRNIR